MREIKFRGYNKSYCKWYYGWLSKIQNRYNVYPVYEDGRTFYPIKVEEDSIGQYTGFQDKNGTKIYEGDILNAGFGIIQIVVFEAGQWFAKCEKDDNFSHSLYSEQNSSHCEIIGNIYEEKLEEYERLMKVDNQRHSKEPTKIGYVARKRRSKNVKV